MSDYNGPRRFAEVWEFNRRGAPYCGTIEQQTKVRSWFERNLIFGTTFHRVMKGLDRKANSMGWSFYSINFDDQPLLNDWANSTRVRIQFYNDPENVPSQAWFDYVVPHELGHVIGWNLLNPVDKTETWAEDFRLWLLTGASSFSPVYSRLGPVMLELGL